MRVIICVLLAIVCAWPAAAGDSAAFPPGTSQFFRTFANDAVVDLDGDVWVALPEGIVRYTAAGRETVLAVPGGAAHRLALAADGSIWFSNEAFVGRVSTAGTILEEYSINGVNDLAVASDGALWYVRSYVDMVGRIADGTPAEFSTTQPWSLAPAEDGAMWVLRTGFGTTADVLDRMADTGAITTIPLGTDVLFGDLQRAADGTLFIGTGIRRGLLRRRPNQSRFTPVAAFSGSAFLVDDGGNIWSTEVNTLHYLSADGTLRFSVELPQDPRLEECSVNVPVWVYRALALDSAGGLWLRIYNDAVGFPAPPCELPEPPEMPTLIRIDAAELVAAHAAHETVPALSPGLLAALAGLLIGIAALRMRA
ncbi:MAG TPA: hypothetical protein VGF28_14425 [Thermoanaerobaculia bacterium]|jgi:hypothetical protein